MIWPKLVDSCFIQQPINSLRLGPLRHPTVMLLSVVAIRKRNGKPHANVAMNNFNTDQDISEFRIYL